MTPAAVLAWALEHRARVVGVSGPQGGGKSTLAAALVAEAAGRGLSAVTLSVDDVYLPHAAQRAVAASHRGNRAMEHRGYPGTHDVALGVQVLDALRRPGRVRLPRYDKSAYGGRGDRAPGSTWPEVEAPVDLVVFEGWMLGFRPAPAVPPELEPANRALAAYAAWTARLDVLVLLRAPAFAWVRAWRVDAEAARRAAGAPGLTDAEARDYIDRFEPAYAAWAEPLWREGIGRPTLRVTLREDRGWEDWAASR